MLTILYTVFDLQGLCDLVGQSSLTAKIKHTNFRAIWNSSIYLLYCIKFNRRVGHLMARNIRNWFEREGCVSGGGRGRGGGVKE